MWAPLAFGLGATFLVQWELKQQGLSWSTISIPAIEDDHLSFLAVVLIMAFDAVLYLVSAWYIESVFPGRYGVAKPWYFPFMPSYWCGQKCAHVRSNKSLVRRTRHAELLEDEEELVGECDNLLFRVCISIVSLRT